MCYALLEEESIHDPDDLLEGSKGTHGYVDVTCSVWRDKANHLR